MIKLFLILSFVVCRLYALEVPFNSNLWAELSFNKIPANQVEYTEKAIKVKVQSSASPLVYKFDSLKDISEFEINLNVIGQINNANEKTDFEEDSYFRLGLVAVGENKLGTAGKLFAPKWVQQLFALAPEGVGLDKIYFYNLGKNKDLVSKERIHPQSKYMYEKIILIKDDKVDVNFKYSLNKPIKTAALWISIDGDNTKSEFETEIKSISIR